MEKGLWKYSLLNHYEKSNYAFVHINEVRTMQIRSIEAASSNSTEVYEHEDSILPVS